MTPRPTPSGSDPKKKAAKAAEKATEPEKPVKKAAAKPTAEKAVTAKATSKKATTQKAGAKKAGTKKTGAAKSAETKSIETKSIGTESAAKKSTTKKASAKKTSAVARKVTASNPAASPEAVVSPALDAGDRERLLAGAHHDPHTVLGAHAVPGGVAFRVFRPYALSVTLVAGDLRAELHDDGDGFYSGLLPLSEVPRRTGSWWRTRGRSRRPRTRTASCPRWAISTCT